MEEILVGNDIRLVIGALMVMPMTTLAQSWPSRTIRFIAPFPPGGGTDLNARMIAPRLAAALGQPVVVENRPGAGGMLGTDIIAKSPPDGYNMVIATIGPIAINPSLYSKMPYDPVKDLAPVTFSGEVPNGLVVHPTLPVKTVKELIALAKKRPRELNFGSSGNGAGDHLAGEMLNVMAGIQMTHVPYKGGAPAMVDLLAGNIQLIFATLATGIPYIKSGKVRAVAMAAPTRFALLPDVPTVAEAGVPGFSVINWAGIFVAAGTPRPVIDRLSVEIGKVLSTPDVKQKLLEMGLVAGSNTPEQFAGFIQAETVKWAKVIQQAKIKIE
jgi:tripartite-type tricarboxylate transporter receptor subunit TctC